MSTSGAGQGIGIENPKIGKGFRKTGGPQTIRFDVKSSMLADLFGKGPLRSDWGPHEVGEGIADLIMSDVSTTSFGTVMGMCNREQFCPHRPMLGVFLSSQP